MIVNFVREQGAQVGLRPRFGGMRFELPVGGVGGLPEAAQIR